MNLQDLPKKELSSLSDDELLTCMLKMPDVEELEFIISEKQRLAGHLFGKFLI